MVPILIGLSAFVASLLVPLVTKKLSLNTPGVAAASMTLMGLVQPYLFEIFIPRDSADDLEPTIRSIGVSSFFWYVFIMILLYCLVFFTLETFNFFNWIQWLKCIGGSTLLTYLLVMALESIKK